MNLVLPPTLKHAVRVERDSFGAVEVPVVHLWGAETQRSIDHFQISRERMPTELIRALVLVKLAAANVNRRLGVLVGAKAEAIVRAATEVLAGGLAAEFPLVVWQTGSGTHSNMNVNEVLANRASELMGGTRGESRLVDAHADVNCGQSSNDVFPTAMSVAAVLSVTGDLSPKVRRLRETLAAKSLAFADIIKVGRTHLQDATPLTLGQEVSGWVAQLDRGLDHVGQAIPHLSELAIGGTAVGTGLNTHPRFAVEVAEELSRLTGHAFRTAPNKFEAMAAHDAMVFAHGALKTLAVALMKIANDVRWLASGPRCGLGELTLPQNEPGSSMMPGKVNPSQCEALSMVCCQVFGNDVAISCGGAMGNFQLNVYKPMIIHNFLMSVRLLGDGAESFNEHCAQGIEANRERIALHLHRSLMLATALSPHIGHERTATIVRHAEKANQGLREAALELGYVTGEQFDEWVRPEAMLGFER